MSEVARRLRQRIAEAEATQAKDLGRVMNTELQGPQAAHFQAVGGAMAQVLRTSAWPYLEGYIFAKVDLRKLLGPEATDYERGYSAALLDLFKYVLSTAEFYHQTLKEESA